MDKWCETIVWQAYPECKPVNDGYYWFLFSSKDGSNYTLQTKWKDGYLKHLDDDEDVIAFADLPTGEIGDEFGFDTALLLMKEGYICFDVSTGDEIRMQFRESEDRYFEKYVHNGVWHPYKLDARQVTGKWRLA